MKKFIILLLTLCSIICFVVGFGCKKADYSSKFNDVYQAEYGEMFYFDTIYIDGQSLVYTVKADGQEVEVKDYGFLMSYNGDYTVEVRFNGNKKVIKQFTIKAVDTKAPQVSLSYYRKMVEVGEQVILPNVTIADNLDNNCTITKSLSLNGQVVSYSGTVFVVSEYGDYIYSATATDASGNTYESKCVISAGETYDKDVAINWTLQDSPLDYIGATYLTSYAVTDEKAYIGTETSLKVTFTEQENARCLILKNSLIDDISQYDYMCFYVYNDMTNSRQLSYNWTNSFNVDLPRGEWTPIILPISESFVSDSQNAAFRELQDWKNLNGQRFYIQQQNLSNATGSVYLSDVYLIKAPTVDEFIEKAEELNETSIDSDNYSSLLSRVVLEYNVLKSTDNATISPYYNQIIENHFKNSLGENYNEDILAIAEDVGISQLVAHGDTWSKPASVIISDKYAYGEEKASFEISFTANRKYANVKVANPFAYKRILSGEVCFYVKNTTNSILEIYTDGGRTNEIKVSNEWQKVVVTCSNLDKIGELVIRVRGINEKVPEPDSSGTSKVYFSNIYALPLESTGIYQDFAFEKPTSVGVLGDVSVVEHEGKTATKVTLDSPAAQEGRMVFAFNYKKLNVLLSSSSEFSVVKISFWYNTDNVSGPATHVGFTEYGAVAIASGTGWKRATINITNPSTKTFYLGVGKNSALSWTNTSDIYGTLYISNLEYEIKEYGNSGVYQDFNEEPATSVGSLGAVSVVEYDGKTATKVTLDSPAAQEGRMVFAFNHKKVNELFDISPALSVVTISFWYNTDNVSGPATHVGFTDYGAVAIASGTGWKRATINITNPPTKTFYLGVGKNSALSWTNTTDIYGTLYISNLEYEINTFEIEYQGVYADWSTDSSLAKVMFESAPVSTTEKVYGTESSSLKASSSGWANGIGLNVDNVVSWLSLDGVQSVTLTFSYYVSSNGGNKYFIAGNQDIAKSQSIGALNTWNTATFTFTKDDITKPLSFVVGFSGNATMGWQATNTTSTFYLGNIYYTINVA